MDLGQHKGGKEMRLRKNFFPLPNEIFNLGLHPTEIVIYAYLMSIEDRKTFQCYPSYTTIGKHCCLCANTVSKYVRLLEEHGLISTERTSIISRKGLKLNGNLMYTILPIQNAVELHHQRQMAELERSAEQYKVRKKAEKLGIEYTPPSTEQSA